jgi:hypothetical protein
MVDFDKKLEEPTFSLSLSLLGVGPFNGIWYNEYMMMIHLKGYLVLLPPSDDHWYHFTSFPS